MPSVPDPEERRNSRRRLRYQLRRAARLDPGIGELTMRIGYPEPRIRQPGFDTLLRIIISQQVSTHSAAAIQRKLEQSCRGRVTWRKVLNRGEDGLRQCGFSRQKTDYALGLAESIRSGALDLDSLHSMDTESVIGELIQVRGFGRWSCQIYAMFALGHRDVYPEDDLGLQLGIQRYLSLEGRPTARETAAIAERWAPYRSAVSLLMWEYYGSTTLE
jgi:DNA-3-methyladenine glycosylase II